MDADIFGHLRTAYALQIRIVSAYVRKVVRYYGTEPCGVMRTYAMRTRTTPGAV